MGEVYRATDTVLKRQVALKVLPPEVANDPERVARFQREAEVLASLNHPNIAHLYGLERSGGTLALVMELVEGPTLADRIAKGVIPLDEALPIARQIAEALECAHEQGIIHRDLKPANIKVRDDGTVKVLDFGLAKAMEPVTAGRPAPSAMTNSPTITSPALMTGVGVLLGTAAYMSPEQAKGRPADKRSDTWAFGCVVYEMVTARRPFGGDDVGELLAQVITATVDWQPLEVVPNPAVVMLVKRCLRKDPRQRLGDGGALRLEIEEALASPPPTVVLSPATRSRATLLWSLSAAAASAAIATAITFASRSPVLVVSGIPAHVAIPLPDGVSVSSGPSAAISHDGQQVAFVGSRAGISQLYVRSLGGDISRPMAGTDNAYAPFFSPDGRWVGFYADGRLKKLSVNDGVVVDLAASRPSGSGGAWGPDDRIIFTSPPGLASISAQGGQPRELMSTEQLLRTGVTSPDVLPVPDKALIALRAALGERGDDGSVDLLTLSTGERRVLVQGGTYPRYLPTGHLTFMRGGSLMAMPFALNTLETIGTPVEVLKGLRTNYGGAATFSCSDTGTCIYAPGSTNAQRTIVMVERNGVARLLPLPAANYSQPRLSPSGDRLLYWLEQARCDIGVADLARGGVTRLTAEGDNHYPVWSPDGQHVTYVSQASGSRGYHVMMRAAGGGSSEQAVLPDNPGFGPQIPLAWSSTGALAFSDGFDVWTVSAPGEKPRPFVSSRFRKTTPAFSRDGRWLAYASDEFGRFEIYVQPYPGPGERHIISTEGGQEPLWSRAGDELFYRNGDQMMSVDLQTSPFKAGRPKVLFTGRYLHSDRRTEYDVSPAGEFVMLKVAPGDEPATQINVLMNWFDELKAKVPPK